MGLKANELRIGNYVKHKSQIRKIIELNLRYCKTDLINNVNYNSDSLSQYLDLQPIPLIEELILKYGKNSIFSNGYSYRITKLGRIEILLGVAIITVIDYLHEFQNLNFALLGCEIEEYKPLY